MRNGHANGHTQHANGHAHRARRHERAPVALREVPTLSRLQSAVPVLIVGAFLVGLVWSLRTLR